MTSSKGIRRDRLGWIPLIAGVIGFCLPLGFVEVEDDSIQLQMWIGGVLLLYLIWIFVLERARSRFPVVMTWISLSIVRKGAAWFLNALLLSSTALFIVVLPVPLWVHLVIGIALLYVTMVTTVQMITGS